MRFLIKSFRGVTQNKKHLLALGLLIVLGAAASLYVFYPRTISFAYAGESCVNKLTLLPSHHSSESDHFAVEFEGMVTLFDKQILSKKTCIKPKVQPQEGVYKVVITPHSLSMYGTYATVVVGSEPEVDLSSIASPLPTNDPIELKLSKPDTTYSYTLRANSSMAECSTEVDSIHIVCDASQLNLEQGSKYDISVSRYFGGKESSIEIGAVSVETLSATTIREASIANEDIIYSKPTKFSFTADKELEGAVVSLATVDGDEVPGVVSIDGESLTYDVKEELARDMQFTITVEQVRAIDGSSLSNPYVLSFMTSGGPKVLSSSIKSYGTSPNASVSIKLDQALLDTTDITELVTVSGVPAQASFTEDTIYISLNNADLCSLFTIQIKGELQSTYEVTSLVEWSQSSRIRCHSISTIGYSVRGRAISAYSFGSGEPMLFIGATHGNELSSGYLMDRFIDDLEANVDAIPEGRRVVVVPRVSPDGFAAITRRNANNVDLNRNFPTADWKSDVTMPGGALVEGGGGSEPLSEPESSAIADYTLALQPKLVLTYHAVANNVIANEAGVSWNAAAKYAQLSGYQHVSKSATGDVFVYDTNGAYEDWLYEKHGIAALLVELSSMSYSQFERNKPAMWAMLDF